MPKSNALQNIKEYEFNLDLWGQKIPLLIKIKILTTNQFFMGLSFDPKNDSVKSTQKRIKI